MAPSPWPHKGSNQIRRSPDTLLDLQPVDRCLYRPSTLLAAALCHWRAHLLPASAQCRMVGLWPSASVSRPAPPVARAARVASWAARLRSGKRQAEGKLRNEPAGRKASAPIAATKLALDSVLQPPAGRNWLSAANLRLSLEPSARSSPLAARRQQQVGAAGPGRGGSADSASSRSPLAARNSRATRALASVGAPAEQQVAAPSRGAVERLAQRAPE